MSLKTVEINEKYDSNEQNIVKDFYLPVLKECVNYDRISGFFTSSSLLISFRGFEQIVKNKGKIRMIVSPRLNKDDVEVMNGFYTDIDDYLASKFEDELFKLENEKYDPKKLLGWLLSNDILEIKVALIKKNGKFCENNEINDAALFHQKIGILTDKYGNKLSFSGSINETAKAWNENNEEFKTFKSWENGQSVYCEGDVDKFEKYWNGGVGNTEVIDFPEAYRNKLIRENEESYVIEFDYSSEEINDIFFEKKVEEIPLFFYQKEAMEKWIENDRKMIFEMATGTGKTRTAIACIQNNLNKFKRNLVVIATPEETLTRQWQREIETLEIKFDRVTFASGTQKYESNLEKNIHKLNLGVIDSLLVLTTHNTAGLDKFTNLIKLVKTEKSNTLFVGDEVHSLGSKIRKKALLDLYKDRIGLSATPSRWFDEDGTENLKRYFNNLSFEFGIDKALNTINPLTGKPFLCNYYYNFKMVYLNDDEIQEYISLSRKISKKYMRIKNKKEKERDSILEEKRANIIKSAQNKIKELENLIIEIEDMEDTIIFTSPALIDDVCRLLRKYNIRYSKFTKEQGKKNSDEYGGISERQYIIEQFKEKNIKVLVAIKCLDEGIDIPTAKRAILLSSTTNPREYIQRIGRVIRQSENKRYAEIYDFIVSIDGEYPDLTWYIKKVEKNEIKRSKYIIENAINNATAFSSLSESVKGGISQYEY